MSKLAIVSLAPAASLTATATSNAVDISDFTGAAKLVLDASAMGGTSPTMDVKLQHCDTQGGTYTDAGIAFTQVTAAASFQVLDFAVDGLKKYVKVVSTLGGTSPTVARSVQLIGNKAL